MFMVTTIEKATDSMTWYLGTRCSNHITSNKDLIYDFDSSKKTKVKSVDNKVM